MDNMVNIPARLWITLQFSHWNDKAGFVFAELKRYHSAMDQFNTEPPEGNTRAINAPNIIIALIALIIGIHAGLGLLSEQAFFDLFVRFSFIPARYSTDLNLPGSPYSEWISPVSYALLHGDWVHVLTNSIWMLAFGSALAWRFGTARFLLFSVLCAIAGAGAHFLANPGSVAPTIGASAAISGHMAAVGRFAFSSGGPLTRSPLQRKPSDFMQPAEPISVLLRNRSALIFIGIWFAVNLLFGLTGAGFGGQDVRIAWEAHLGGFLAGLLLFPLLDPVARKS
uniref:rhomboid family intramembrane serine protease n=1 Tax=Pararhizobium sp. IMCC3301 TaxID=3067904 RepID=UPI0027408F86|nr:rhomboid family intramembrane serine protease [Pararhizobium sp. IMCC3301]